jgi:hypothetical protein
MDAAQLTLRHSTQIGAIGSTRPAKAGRATAHHDCIIIPIATPNCPFTLGPMQRLREHAQDFIGGLVVVVTILGFFLLLPWPDWLIWGLLIIIAFLSYLLWKVAPPRIDAGDQERLDDLLQVLNRRAEENVAAQDFYATWNSRIMNPIKVLVYERAGIEHHFLDHRLEEKRAALYKRADELLGQEANHGFPPQGWGTSADRVPGYSPSESEGLPDREKAVEIHRSAIFPAADAFLRAHADLVKCARDRGYRVDALTQKRHPKVREWDRLQDETEQRAQERAFGGPGGVS